MLHEDDIATYQTLRSNLELSLHAALSRNPLFEGVMYQLRLFSFVKTVEPVNYGFLHESAKYLKYKCHLLHGRIRITFKHLAEILNQILI